MMYHYETLSDETEIVHSQIIHEDGKEILNIFARRNRISMTSSITVSG